MPKKIKIFVIVGCIIIVGLLIYDIIIGAWHSFFTTLLIGLGGFAAGRVVRGLERMKDVQ